VFSTSKKMSFDEYRTDAKKSALDLINAVPQKIAGLQSKIQAAYNLPTPTDAAKKFRADFDVANKSGNSVVTDAVGFARDELTAAIQAIRTFERFVTLHVPIASDGNNFGVEVQMQSKKMLNEFKKELKAAFDSLACYHVERADLLAKFGNENSETATQTELSAKKTGEKDSNEKTVSQESKSVKVTKEVASDAIGAVVACDVKWYFNTLNMLSLIQDDYMYAADLVTKNLEKLENPRGANGGANPMHMY